jgi:hypothetical protein
MNHRVRFKELFNRRALVRREIVRDRLRTRCGGPPFYSISVACYSPSRRGYPPSRRDIVVTGQSRQDTVSVMHHPLRIRAGRTWKYVVLGDDVAFYYTHFIERR